MASTSCFLHHHVISTPKTSFPSQRYGPNKPNQVVCRAQNKAQAQDEDATSAVSRRLALSVLIGAAAVGSKVSPADAAYGESANIFGKPKTNTDFLAINGDGFKLQVPSKWNPSKDVEFPGQVLKFEDNFDTISNISVMITPTDKKSITDFGSPEEFLSKVVLGEEIGKVRIMTFNRPRQLNVISANVVALLTKYVEKWEKDSDAELVLIKGAGRAFSAGGDLKMFYDGRNLKDSCLEVAYRMYCLCYHILTYKKTQVALVHGIAMGGGATLVVPMKFSVVTAKTSKTEWQGIGCSWNGDPFCSV